MSLSKHGKMGLNAQGLGFSQGGVGGLPTQAKAGGTRGQPQCDYEHLLPNVKATYQNSIKKIKLILYGLFSLLQYICYSQTVFKLRRHVPGCMRLLRGT